MPFTPFRFLMNQIVTVQRATYTKGTLKEDVEAWGNHATNKRAAIWPADSVPDMAREFRARDIVVSHIICTTEDLTVKATDRIYETSETGVYYVVMDYQKFDNFGVFPHPIYVIAANKRTV